jgi:hypothetical protein
VLGSARDQHRERYGGVSNQIEFLRGSVVALQNDPGPKVAGPFVVDDSQRVSIASRDIERKRRVLPNASRRAVSHRSAAASLAHDRQSLRAHAVRHREPAVDWMQSSGSHSRDSSVGVGVVEFPAIIGALDAHHFGTARNPRDARLPSGIGVEVSGFQNARLLPTVFGRDA